MKLVVAVSGASGAPYAKRLLDFLAAEGAAQGVSCDLVFTDTGKQVWKAEVGAEPSYPFTVWKNRDFTAPFASGSAQYEAMVVVPCSAGMMARIAHGVSMDLVGRAADVMLKERRRLVLLVRETPLHLGHLRSMAAVTEMGGIVMPPVPAFYARPTTIDDIVDHTVGRALDLFGLDTGRVVRWGASGRQVGGGRAV